MSISKIYTNESDKEGCVYLQDNDLIKKLNEKYTFEAAFVPHGWDIAFLLLKEDIVESMRDEWKAVFFKKKLNMGGTGTITLDNFETAKENGYEFDFYKEIDGNFHDIVRMSCELIEKHNIE